MKPLLISLCAILSACTYADGNKVFLSGDYERVDWRGGKNPRLILIRAMHSPAQRNAIMGAVSAAMSVKIP